MAQANKAEQALRAQKDARQKKVLFVLAPLFIGLLAWQGPGMLKAFTGGDPPPAATAEAAPAATTTPDPASAAAPSTAAGDPAAVPAAGGALPDADEPYAPGSGQLVSFDRFVGKDPFRQQVSAKTADEGGSGGGAKKDDESGGKPSSGGDDGGDGGGGGDGSDGDDGGDSGNAFKTATLAVNGISSVISVGDTFPVSDPVFRLVSIGASSVKIGLVSGEFSNGASTITVKRGKTVTLISQPDGFRFTIKLVDLGEPKPQQQPQP